MNMKSKNLFGSFSKNSNSIVDSEITVENKANGVLNQNKCDKNRKSVFVKLNDESINCYKNSSNQTAKINQKIVSQFSEQHRPHGGDTNDNFENDFNLEEFNPLQLDLNYEERNSISKSFNFGSSIEQNYKMPNELNYIRYQSQLDDYQDQLVFTQNRKNLKKNRAMKLNNLVSVKDTNHKMELRKDTKSISNSQMNKNNSNFRQNNQCVKGEKESRCHSTNNSVFKYKNESFCSPIIRSINYNGNIHTKISKK